MVAVARMPVGFQSPRGSGAPGEDASVAQRDPLGEPVRDLVGANADVVGQVDHALDGEVGVGVAAPGADLVGGDRGAGVLDPAHQVVAFAGGLGEVQVEDRLPHRPPDLRAVRDGEVEAS